MSRAHASSRQSRGSALWYRPGGHITLLLYFCRNFSLKLDSSQKQCKPPPTQHTAYWRRNRSGGAQFFLAILKKTNVHGRFLHYQQWPFQRVQLHHHSQTKIYIWAKRDLKSGPIIAKCSYKSRKRGINSFCYKHNNNLLTCTWTVYLTSYVKIKCWKEENTVR